MALQFDKDERAATALIRKYPQIFDSIGHELEMVSFRSDISELMLDARIEERMKHTGEDKETAEAAVIKELKETKQ